MADAKSSEPIRVAPRVRKQKRKNVFYDDRGFPDQSHDFDVVLRKIDGGTVLRKRRHPAPALDPKADSLYAVAPPAALLALVETGPGGESACGPKPGDD